LSQQRAGDIDAARATYQNRVVELDDNGRIPTVRMFWDLKPSNGWENHHVNAPSPKKTFTPNP